MAYVSSDHISALCHERQTARRLHNYTRADEIRDELNAIGVVFDDKTRTWTGPDGRSGTWGEGRGPYAPPESPRGPPRGPLTVARSSYPTACRCNTTTVEQLSDDINGFRVRCPRCYAEAIHILPSKPAPPSRPPYNSSYNGPVGPSSWEGEYSNSRYDSYSKPSYSAQQYGRGYDSGAGWRSDYEISQLCHQRQTARRKHKYQEADRLRDELSSLGVVIDDNTRSWYIEGTSRSGTWPEGPYMDAPPQGAGAVKRGREPAEIAAHELDDAAISQLCHQRQSARRRHQFREADYIRDQLNGMGVTFDDSARTWSLPDGRAGTWGDSPVFDGPTTYTRQALEIVLGPFNSPPPPRQTGAPSSAPPSQPGGVSSVLMKAEEEYNSIGYLEDSLISDLLQERQTMRRKHDFAGADSIRDFLATAGVSYQDEQRTWETEDGRNGTWNP
eukprot:Sspe_Gene.26228::Locus_10766_Transcript_1_1_Confidence_1.000_Length_1504::g.26228::m.26228